LRFFQLNFLSVGDVVISTASDFVGAVVGESQKKTNAMLEKARGKVLVIDEAYNLDDNLYGKQVTHLQTVYSGFQFLGYMVVQWSITPLKNIKN
jgi:hypothetical protein